MKSRRRSRKVMPETDDNEALDPAIYVEEQITMPEPVAEKNLIANSALMSDETNAP